MDQKKEGGKKKQAIHKVKCHGHEVLVVQGAFTEDLNCIKP